MVWIFGDSFGNTAKIEEVEILPYKGAEKKQKGYRLSLTADYDNGFLYHVSVHETEAEAMAEMRKYSCDTWK